MQRLLHVCREIRLLMVVCLTATLFQGCATRNANAYDPKNEPFAPRLTTIGTGSNIITAIDGRDVRIPIEGRDMDLLLDWNIYVTGTVPARFGNSADSDCDFYIIRTPNQSRDQHMVVFKPGYFKNLEDGDTIEILFAGRRSLLPPDGVEGSESRIARSYRILESVLWAKKDKSGNDYKLPDQATKASVLESVETLSQALDIERPQGIDLKASDNSSTIDPDNKTRVERFLELVEAKIKDFSYIRASRRFTYYSTSYYRENYLSSRLKPHEIRAFPLPPEEVKTLFGDEVNERYFAVKFSTRNSHDFKKIIHTGMIQARGHALVEAEQGGKKFRFTVPVEVTPMSMAQVYTVVDDTERNQPRNVFFQTAEFVFAIGTAYATAFGVPADLDTAIQLTTGIGIPEGKKLWRNRVPDFKRNIVEFGAPDMFEIAADATTSHLILFFPRSKVENLIIDSASVGQHSGVSFEPPNANVVYLEFDNLDVPYSRNVSSRALSVTETAAALDGQIDQLLQDYDQFRQQLKNSTSLTIDEIDTSNKTLKDLIKHLDALTKDLLPTDGKPNQPRFLYSEESGKLTSLKDDRKLLQQVLKSLLKGSAPEHFEDTVKRIEKNTGVASARLKGYQAIVNELLTASNGTPSDLANINQNRDADAEEVERIIERIRKVHSAFGAEQAKVIFPSLSFFPKKAD